MTKMTSATTESMTVQELLSLDLSSAEEDFAIANTPFFLLRKLRINPFVHIVARRASSRALLQSLQKSLTSRPRTARTALRPYFYLAALGIKNDPAALKKAASFECPHHVWFEPMIAAIIASRKATATETYRVPSRIKVAMTSSPEVVFDSKATVISRRD